VNKEKWILERAYDLLSVKYFHVVFTLPSELRSICYQNQRLIYNLLFSCAWQTLDDFSKDPRQRLMARMGMIAVLHTWTQTLLYHPCLCRQAGRISIVLFRQEGLDDSGNWKNSKSNGNFLFYDGAVANAFRGKFLEQLIKLYKTKKLTLEGKISHLKQYHNFWKLKKKLYETNWIVHTEDPFKKP
jgi:hypothetical protein